MGYASPAQVTTGGKPDATREKSVHEMTPELEQKVARLERIIRGENGYYEGLAARMPKVEQAIEDIRDAVAELKRIEAERSKRHEADEGKRIRRTWAVVVPLALMAIGQILSVVVDFFLTMGATP